MQCPSIPSVQCISHTRTFGPAPCHSDRERVPAIGWSPGFSHGSHTPNRGVVEADATLPLWTSQQFLRPLVIACCDRAPSSTDEHAHDPVGTGLHTHPTDPLEPGKTLPQFTALRASCNAHHVGSEIEASSRCLTKCTSGPCDNLPRRPTSGKSKPPVPNVVSEAVAEEAHLCRATGTWRLVEGTSIPRSTLALLVCGRGQVDRQVSRARKCGTTHHFPHNDFLPPLSARWVAAPDSGVSLKKLAQPTSIWSELEARDLALHTPVSAPRTGATHVIWQQYAPSSIKGRPLHCPQRKGQCAQPCVDRHSAGRSPFLRVELETLRLEGILEQHLQRY